MLSSYRAVQTGAIWLTAIMTLVAGTPHFDCRCPNGNVKPFCLALLTGKTGCCCEGSCCAALPGDDGEGLATCDSPFATAAKETCCCCQARQANAKGESGAGDARLGKSGCQKTLAQAAVAVAESPVKDTVQALAAHPVAPVLAPVSGQDRFGPCDHLTDYPSHRRPPPTDLVTVLQHFLI